MRFDRDRAERERLERKFKFRNSWDMFLILLALLVLLLGLLVVLDWTGAA